MSSTDDFDAHLGRTMAEWREFKGLSQEALAELLGRDQPFVSKIERGQRRITVLELMSWAAALDLDAAVVLKGAAEAWRQVAGSGSIWERERDA